MQRILILFFIFVLNRIVHSQSVDGLSGLLPWESALQLGNIRRPLGLTLNRSSIAHQHFLVGYLALHSFMYDEAQQAFDLALNVSLTFIEARIGKILGCKYAIWATTDFDCGLSAYNATLSMLESSNMTLNPLQSDLLSTAYQWYSNRSSVATGEKAFLSSITDLAKKYNNESDILVWWGLSLLNVAFQKEFEGQLQPKTMLESREVLKKALELEPTHPGALHYLIHAYDIDQVDIAEIAADHAVIYGKTVQSLSHAKHMPAHIWMRTGAWIHAIAADASAIQASMAMCLNKVLNRTFTIVSTQLEPVFMLMNTTKDVALFLRCDAENRAHSTEWLTYSRLQTGDWLGSLALLHDLYLADNRSTLTPDHYLPFAYRAHARTVVELFFWFPYTDEFLTKTQKLTALNPSQIIISHGDNTNSWYPIWGEAGYRFADGLRLLTIQKNNQNTSGILSTVDEHITRLAILTDRALPLSRYISESIYMMIPQLRGIRYYINGSWQQSLNEFYTAVRLESKLVADGNSPTLIYARSSELLAMHLLLIFNKTQQRSIFNNSSVYMLNGTWVAIEKFPLIALDLYKQADQTAPNRAINTLGMARANVEAGQDHTAVTLYQNLHFQMTSSNRSDESFLREADQYIDQHSSATSLSHMSYIGLAVSLIYFFV